MRGHISQRQNLPEHTRLLRRFKQPQKPVVSTEPEREEPLPERKERARAKLPGDRKALRGIPVEGYGGALGGSRPDQLVEAGQIKEKRRVVSLFERVRLIREDVERLREAA